MTMVFTGSALTLTVSAVLLAGAGQTPNPRQGDAATIQAGASLFREHCADCHGADAKGDRGPGLTGLWATADSDQRVFQTIRSGVPGSIMPPSSAPDQELRAIVAYLRSISTAAPEASAGNAPVAEAIFTASCASCHRVNGRGGRLGPDLSRIAANQSNQALARAIRDASAAFTIGYEPVRWSRKTVRQIRGTRKGEDPFSIQIMDTAGRLQGYLKANLREVTRDKKSLMPDFGVDRLSDEDLNHLLAFLGTLRIAPPPARAADRPVDDR